MLKNTKFKLLDSYKRQDDGATAIEFALLAVPFMMLLFSIIELAIVFFLGSTLNHAMSEASRQIRTGEFQAKCLTAGDFKDLVCDGMGSLGNCSANLRFDVEKSSSAVFEPDLLSATPPFDPDNPNPEDDVYTATGPRDVVVVRAQYYHPLNLPGGWTRLSNEPGNRRLISAVTAFRNEPFPNGC